MRRALLSPAVFPRLTLMIALFGAVGLPAAAEGGPLTVPDLALWLDADASHVTKDGSNRVSAWNDITGAANNTVAQNVSQSDSAKQPLWVSSGIGGQPALYFDGGDWLDNLTDNLVASGSARTIFIVGDADDTSPGGVPFTFRTSKPIFAAELVKIDSSFYVYSGNGPSASNATIPVEALTIVRQPFISVFRSAGGAEPPTSKIAVDLNGIAQVVTQSTGVYPEAGSIGFTVGNREDVAGLAWPGMIAEVLVYNRSLTPAELNEVGWYLAGKYGIQTAYVPEPGSLVLLVSGGLGLMWFAAGRRRSYSIAGK